MIVPSRLSQTQLLLCLISTVSIALLPANLSAQQRTVTSQNAVRTVISQGSLYVSEEMVNSATRLIPANEGPPSLAPQNVFTEDFEGAFPGVNWITPPDGGGSGCRWGKTSALADSGTFSVNPVASSCTLPPDPGAGPLPANALIFMIYGPFDLSSAVTAEVTFRHAIKLQGADFFVFGHLSSADCNGDYTISGLGGGAFAWQDGSMDISARAGSANVCIAFALQTDAVPGVGPEGIFLDNVAIVKDDQLTTADLALTQVDVADGTYARGDTISVYNRTENIGSETSPGYQINFFASADANVTDQDVFLGGIGSAPLDVGQVNEFNALIPLPNDLPNMDLYIGAVLGVTDANSANNSNSDPVPITINSDPDIQIRPLSLDFAEVAPSPPSGVETGNTAMSPAEHTRRILPELMDKAHARGRVDLIIGLNTPFKPEGTLSTGQKQDQQQAIQVTGNQLLSQLQGLNVTLKNQYRHIPYLALSADAVSLDFLARSALVSSIAEDTLNKLYMASSNQVIGSPLAWQEGYDGNGWAVAVLDTGLDKSHSWFTTGGNKVISEACYGSNVVGESESLCPGKVASSTAAGSGVHCDLALDGCDHGTHVAGTVAGNNGVGPNFGVARGADIIAIQVFSKFFTENDCGVGEAPCVLSSSSDQIAALERVLTLSASIDIAAVNMSIGGGAFADQASCDAANSGEKAAIDNLRAAGVATVISAGNDSMVDMIGAPGCISTAISVGATQDNDKVAGFSNIYPQIHLLAPGVAIDSSIPGNAVGSKQGTSMSSPHVAGAWAVMKQRQPGDSVSDILNTFQSSATLVDDLRIGGVETGIPRINLDLALGEPRTTFGIFNKGTTKLTVSSITPETPAPWISIDPAPPYEIAKGGLQVVSVLVDFNSAPDGGGQRRLLINSDDPDESPYPDGVFVNVTTLADPQPEFSSNPVAGATIAFPPTTVSTSSTEQVVRVSNTGNANLIMVCGLSGANSSQFTLAACSSPVVPAGETEISVLCTPSSVGAKTAFLDVSTNDSDEALVSYKLTCTGQVPPVEDDIFANGFEGGG